MAQAARSRLSEITETSRSNFDRSNLQSKLRDYLLNSSHSDNQGKAELYRRALGFDQNNWKDLASQLRFDRSQAVLQRETVDGKFYEQMLAINGRNGRTVSLKFIFKEDKNGIVRFVTGIPRSK